MMEEKPTMTIPLPEMMVKYNNSEPVPYIWSGIKKNSYGFIFGPAKSGKTTFCENLGLSLALKVNNFLGMPITGDDYKVLFVSLEEFWHPRSERNLKQIKDIAESNSSLLYNYNVVEESFPRYIIDCETWNLLETAINESGANVVFVDSLSRMYQGDIESSETAQKISKKLREMTNSLNITLIIIHHTPKIAGRPLTIDSLAGSRILSQEADFMIGVCKTYDGSRYLKEVALRYKQENDKVLLLKLNENLWFEPNSWIGEQSLLFQSDGRTDSTNKDLIYNYIVENAGNGTPINSSEVFQYFSNTMKKTAFYDNVKKLQEQALICVPSKGKIALVKNSAQE